MSTLSLVRSFILKHLWYEKDPRATIMIFGVVWKVSEVTLQTYRAVRIRLVFTNNMCINRTILSDDSIPFGLSD